MGKVKMRVLQAKALQILYFKKQQMGQLSPKKQNQPIIGPIFMKQKVCCEMVNI